MGWKGPRAFDVTLPTELKSKAGGVNIVTCRYIGAGRAEKIATKRAARGMERLERMGPETSKQIDEHQQKLKEGTIRLDPDKMLLQTYPPDLVLTSVVKALDGERLRDDDREDWVDEIHPDVAEFVALAVIRECELEAETEEEQGEDSGGSSDSSSVPKVTPMRGRNRRGTATS